MFEPYSQPTPGSSSGHRVRSSRAFRSSSTASGISYLEGFYGHGFSPSRSLFPLPQERGNFVLPRQQGFGAVGGQVGVEGVDYEGQEAVVADDQRQLDEALLAELLQRVLESAAAHFAVVEELPGRS